jgi:hypothetical protein
MTEQKEKLATLAADLRKATTIWEQARITEARRTAPAQVVPNQKGPLYPRLPETNSSNQWLDGNREPFIDAMNCK